jgi:hypothetical protein
LQLGGKPTLKSGKELSLPEEVATVPDETEVDCFIINSTIEI